MIISTSAFSQTLKDHKYSLGTGMQNSDIVATDNSLIINYSISELDAESFITEDGKWFRIGIPGHIPASDIGKPELPVFSRLIVIPDGYTYKVRISDINSSKIRPYAKRIKGDLYPVQEGETKDMQRDKPQFRIDKAVYAERKFIKSDTVKIEPLGRARGKNLATLSIYPVRYNPHSKVLEVITSMKIDIIFTPTGVTSKKSLFPESVLFGNQLEKGTLNYNPENLITGYSDKPVRMIILTDTAFRKNLEPFIRWKKQKGFKLDILYTGAAFAGSNYIDIKKSIAAIYNSSTADNPPPEYLLIVGNTTKIPYYGTGSITDLYYGEFDGGGDYIPEMFIGRLPVADANDLKTVVSKILQYEKYEFADTNLFHSNALATAGIDDSHATYMNGQVNYVVSNYLSPANKINQFHFLYPNAKKDTIVKLINRGLSFINYTGHGSTSGWLYLNINIPDTASFKNKNMYPFVISNACQTSRFNTSSFGNAMVLAKKKGAIGYIGASADSYWDEEYYWAVGVGPIALNPTYGSTGLGALDRLFHTHGESASDWYITMGQVNYAGNLAVSGSTTSRKKYYWEIYNLVGDPSVLPIIGTPDTFKITLPDTLPNNLKSYSLIADPFSYVAISHFDTLWDASYVSPSGSVTLDMPGLTNDSCLVVITGQNKIPLIKTIYFSAINKAYINLSGTAVNDSLGNDNSIADYNETIFLKLTISNLGNLPATGATAEISCTSPYVTIINGNGNIGTLLPETQKVLHKDLKFSISGNVPDNSAVTFDLKIKYGTVEKLYKIDIYIHSPKLEIVHYIIDDTETGNGNFLADPGETVKFIFSVLNLGSSNTSGQFSISSPDPEISLIDPSKNSGNLTSGAMVQIPLEAKISSSAIPGTTINILADLNCDPFIKSKSFSFRIGKFQETFESASFKIFPWINLSSKPWTVTQLTPYEGIIAAKSGAISDNQSTILGIKANYSNADSLRFFYKVSSETNYDKLIFKLNNVETFSKSGETSWTRKAVGVPAGINKFEWIYKKDGSVSAGSDCAWIDLIDFTGTGTVTYIARDIMAARLVSPVQSANMDLEEVTIKLLNLGPDTIQGFNLAYSINNSMPVIQHFKDKIIYNGDSVTVTFNAEADLSHYGDYELVVFSFANSDDNLKNDTLRTIFKNRTRRLGDNARIDDENPLHIGPNPFSDELYILIESEKGDTVNISLVNSVGKKVIDRKEYHLSSGATQLQISGAKLEPAVYYLIIEFPGRTETRKVIKLKY
ncbi:MAG: C25 family cysteine peptidase [Bacteroidia bacterium]|nr:C25 family cysteine peptidase [Bacteroidia bacterium]